jgi:tRNA dimethylallyltransferase
VELISDYDLLVITGPTASGKTSLAVGIANNLDGEIISADSRQVYRDYEDYEAEGTRVPYHLIDIVDPGYKYNVFEYQRDFLKVYTSLRERRVFPVVCGGSGMYIDSIITGYKMQEVPPDSGLRMRLEKKSMEELKAILSSYKNLHNITDLENKKRIIRAIEIAHFDNNKETHKNENPGIRSLVVGVLIDRDTRRKRISERLIHRLNEGMVEEVKKLIDAGISADTLIYYGLEYKYITLYLTGKLSFVEMARDLETAIHQFAKRQMTWFRGMEKRGIKINWVNGEAPLEERVAIVMDLLEAK